MKMKVKLRPAKKPSAYHANVQRQPRNRAHQANQHQHDSGDRCGRIPKEKRADHHEHDADDEGKRAGVNRLHTVLEPQECKRNAKGTAISASSLINASSLARRDMRRTA